MHAWYEFCLSVSEQKTRCLYVICELLWVFFYWLGLSFILFGRRRINTRKLKLPPYHKRWTIRWIPSSWLNCEVLHLNVKCETFVIVYLTHLQYQNPDIFWKYEVWWLFENDVFALVKFVEKAWYLWQSNVYNVHPVLCRLFSFDDKCFTYYLYTGCNFCSIYF